MLDSAQTVLAMKEFPKEGSCAERTELVKVLVEAWLIQLEASGIEETPPPTTPSPPQQELFRVLGLGLGISWTGASAAPSISLETELSLGTRWAAHARLSGVAPHREKFAEGVLEWWRVGLEFGPRLRLAQAPVRVDAIGLIGASWLSLRGAGFAQEFSQGLVTPSLGAALAVHRSTGRLDPFIILKAHAWLRVPTAVVQSPESTKRLGPWEMELAVGVRKAW